MDNKSLYDDLICKIECALTHDMHVCEQCRKCEGNNAAEIRINLIRDLCAANNKLPPWWED